MLAMIPLLGIHRSGSQSQAGACWEFSNLRLLAILHFTAKRRLQLAIIAENSVTRDACTPLTDLPLTRYFIAPLWVTAAAHFVDAN